MQLSVNRILNLIVAFAALIVTWPVVAHVGQKDAEKPKEDDREVRLGREAAAENDKQVKLIGEPAIVERVNRIGQEIAAIANDIEIKAYWGRSQVRKFAYSFKVVDEKDVNAYSLPGGYIYVNKGLLDYVRSDDELAGVLAHEVAHASHHHMMKLLDEQGKMQPWALLAILGSVLVGKGGNSTGATAFAAQLVQTAKLNEMGVEAEKDADQTGIRYLMRTRYKPTGLLTFMERLAQDERNRPIVTLGIFQTHPPSPDRARSARTQLAQLNVPIRRREVDPSLRATVSIVTVNNSPVAEVKMFRTTIAKLVPMDQASAEQRGAKLASMLDRLMDDGLQNFEVRVSGDKRRVIGGQATIIEFTQADADAQHTTVAQLAHATAEAVRNAIWQDPTNRPLGTILVK